MDEIRKKLESLADPEYQRFSASLLPGVSHVLGVRLPHLRKLAAQIAKGNFRAYLQQAQDSSFEEIMLQGMVIGCALDDVEEALTYTRRFLPKIDNWSVCDSFCSSLRVAKRHPDEVWDFLQPCFPDNGEFIVRFGAVMLLDYFVTANRLDAVLELLDSVRHPGYYAKMAVAWAVSICFVRFPQETMAYLKRGSLDPVTYQKALQKIVESRCVDIAWKTEIRTMRKAARSL